MPVDSSIALAGKPPVLPEVDINKTFLTLGQLKYLNSETLRTEAQAALAGTQGQAALADLAETNRVREALAGGQRLNTLGTPPALQAPPPGGPPFAEATLAALHQGESTPPVDAATGGQGAPRPQDPQATPPGQARAAMEARLMAAGPKGIEAVKAWYALDKQKLDQSTAKLTIASNAYATVHDQPSLELANAVVEHETGTDFSHLLPRTYSPEAVTQFAGLQRSVQQHLEQQNKERELSENLVLKGIYGDVLVPRFPGGTPGAAGSGSQGTITQVPGLPGTPTPVPGTERPLSGGEAQAKANLDLATASNARVLEFEEALARDPANPQTPNYANVSPSLAEETAAHGGTKIGTVVGGAAGTVVGALKGGPWGATAGGATGAYLGNKAGEALDTVGNRLLSKERQQLNGEQLNFIAAVRGEETSRITRDVFDLERERFFPKYGDPPAEVLRKRQVRQEALSAMATRTNRPQDSIPIGQLKTAPTHGGPATPAARSPHADKATHQLTLAEAKEELAWLQNQQK